MRAFLFILLLSLLQTVETANAGTPQNPEISVTPICSTVYNSTSYKVYGSMETDKFVGPDGTQLHHKKTLVLAPQERVEVCSTGPFFPGGKLELTLRTLIPIFSCQTKLGQEIVIRSTLREDGGTKTWADCFE